MITEEHYNNILNLTYNFCKYHHINHLDIAHDLICNGTLDLAEIKKYLQTKKYHISDNQNIVSIEDLDNVEPIKELTVYKYCYTCQQVLPDYLFPEKIRNKCIYCDDRSKKSQSKRRKELKDGYVIDLLKKNGIINITNLLIKCKKKQLLEKRNRKLAKSIVT